VEDSINSSYYRSSDSILVDEIRKKVFWQLKKEKNLYPCECGWSLEGTKQIQLLHCGFFYHNEVDIEKARELLMTISNLFLIAINENERIRPYLGKYPFKLENLLIDIFFKNSDGSELGQEQLHVAALGEGTLQYMISCSATERLRTIQIETYKEAEAKLAAVAKR
jgi:hypothetical protein